jgi:oligoribonuclease (3'-5' exoribonuclease)
MIAVVKNCIDADRRQTVREISEIVDISKTTVHRIMSDELNMSRVCARWVPRLLKDDEKELTSCSRFNRVP